MWGCASVCDGWTSWWLSLLCQGDFKPLCSFLGHNHNLSLLYGCKPDLQSIDSGHGVTYYGNTSFIKVTEEVIQIRMVLDMLTAAQGGTCAIIKVYIFLIYLAIYQLL